MKFEKVREQIAQWWILAFVAGMGLLTLNCAIPENPGMPSWDIPLALPFSTETYGLSDLVDSTGFDSTGSGILEGPNGSLQFVLEDSIPKMTLEEDQFAFDPGVEQDYIVPTEALILDNLSAPRDEVILLDDILEGTIPDYDDGDVLPIPEFSIPQTVQEIEFAGLDSLQSVHIMDNGGGMNLTISNNTTVYWDSIVVEVQRESVDQPGTFIPMGNMSYYEMDGGDAEEQFLDLSGQTLTAFIRLVVDGGGPGHPLPGTEMNHGDGLSFGMVVQTLICDSAFAIIPGQTPESRTDSLELAGDDWIQLAEISSGSIHFEVENQTDVNSRITISFPDIMDENDDAWTASFILNRNEDGNAENEIRDVDLTGYRLELPLPQNEGEVQRLLATTEVEILGTGSNGPEYSRIAVGDSVITTFSTTELIFSYFEGFPKAIELEVDQQTVDIDIFESQPDLQSDLLHKMSLADVHIEAELNNTFNLPVNLILEFEATNSAMNEHVTLIDTIVLEGQQNEIEDITGFETILNILPDQLTFTASVQTGRDFFPFDPGVPYTVSTTDSLEGIFRLVAPFSLKFTEETEINPEPQTMEPLEQNDIQQAKLSVDLTNNIPVGGKIYMLVGSFEGDYTDEERMSWAKDELVRGNADRYNLFEPIDLPVPELNEDGTAVAPMETNVIITLEKEKFDLFTQPNIFTKQILVMYPTLDENDNAINIVMQREDFMSVGMIAEITYRVNADSTGGDE